MPEDRENIVRGTVRFPESLYARLEDVVELRKKKYGRKNFSMEAATREAAEVWLKHLDEHGDITSKSPRADTSTKDSASKVHSQVLESKFGVLSNSDLEKVQAFLKVLTDGDSRTQEHLLETLDYCEGTLGVAHHSPKSKSKPKREGAKVSIFGATGSGVKR